jgi:hypothetical protein
MSDERIEGARVVALGDAGPFVVQVADHRGVNGWPNWLRSSAHATQDEADRAAHKLVRDAGDRWCIRILEGGHMRGSWQSPACRKL